jgi:hypothetical protein
MHDPEHELVTVYTAYDELTAEVVKVALEAEGIRSFIENAHQAALTGVLPAELKVREVDEERARKIIEEHESLPPESTSNE